MLRHSCAPSLIGLFYEVVQAWKGPLELLPFLHPARASASVHFRQVGIRRECGVPQPARGHVENQGAVDSHGRKSRERLGNARGGRG